MSMPLPAHIPPDLPLRVLLVCPDTNDGTDDTAHVTQELSRSLRANGVDARILMPCGPSVDRTPLYRHPDPVSVELGIHEYFVAILTAAHPADSSVPVYLVDHRDFFANTPDNPESGPIERAAFLSASVFPACRALHWIPHVVHSFGWQAAYVAALARTREYLRGYQETATVLTLSTSDEPTADVMSLSRLGISHEQAVDMGLYTGGAVSLGAAGRSHADLVASPEESGDRSAGEWIETYRSLSRLRSRRDSRPIR
ncbi:MAG: glycogen/starch synthase [Spirochaetaceae bacterium]